MSAVSDPVVRAGVTPIDLTAWNDRRAKRIAAAEAPAVLRPERIKNEPQGSEADWLNWYLKTTEHDAISNHDLRAMVIAKGKGRKIMPGTAAQHEAYTSEFDGQELGEFIRQFRQKAVYGMWPDGSKNGPALPSMSIEQLKRLVAQSTEMKYLKWFRGSDPVGYAKWLETHPTYRTRSSTTVTIILAPNPATDSPKRDTSEARATGVDA